MPSPQTLKSIKRSFFFFSYTIFLPTVSALVSEDSLKHVRRAHTYSPDYALATPMAFIRYERPLRGSQSLRYNQLDSLLREYIHRPGYPLAKSIRPLIACSQSVHDPSYTQEGRECQANQAIHCIQPGQRPERGDIILRLACADLHLLCRGLFTHSINADNNVVSLQRSKVVLSIHTYIHTYIHDTTKAQTQYVQNTTIPAAPRTRQPASRTLPQAP